MAGEGEGEGEGEEALDVPPQAGEGEGEGEPEAPRLVVGADQARAGVAVAVDCVGGELTVEPAEGVTIGDDGAVTATVVGAYTVRCGELNAALTVTAGVVATLQITDLEAVAPDDSPVRPVVAAADAFGNVVEAPELTWSFDDPTFSARGRFDGSVVIEGSGWAELIATEAESGIEARRRIGVDRHPPVLVVDAPARGLMTSEGQVHVAGTVVDDVGVASILVEDVEVGPDADAGEGEGEGEAEAEAEEAEDGAFATVVELDAAAPGVRVVTVQARDLLGRSVQVRTGVMHGQFAGDGERVEGAARFRLNPTILSDDDDVDDDLSTLSAAGIGDLPYTPTDIDTDCNGTIHLLALRHEPVQVVTTPVAGGLNTEVIIPGVELDYDGRGCIDFFGCRCADLDSTATMAIEATVRSTLTAQACAAVVDTQVTRFEVVGLDLNDPALEGSAEDFIKPEIEDRIEGSFRPVIRDVVHDAVSTLVDAVGLPDSLTLPAPIGLQIELTPCTTDVSFDATGGDFDQAALPDAGGALRLAGASPDLSGEHALGLALHLDLVNQLLHLAWSQDAALIEVAGGSVQMLLPPFLGPPAADGPADAFVMSVVDTLATVDSQIGELVIAGATRIPMRAEVRGDSVVLVATAQPDEIELYLDLVQGPGPAAIEALGGLDALARDRFLNALAGLELPFPLPALELTEGTPMGLADPIAAPGGPGGDHLAVTADLAPALPPPQ